MSSNPELAEMELIAKDILVIEEGNTDGQVRARKSVVVNAEHVLASFCFRPVDQFSREGAGVGLVSTRGNSRCSRQALRRVE